MTSRDLVYWLQGFFEISGDTSLTPKQVDIIKNHLAMVFVHEIDPSFGDKLPELQEVHDKLPELQSRTCAPNWSIDHIKFTC